MRTDYTSLNRPIRWGIIGCGAVTEIKSGPALYKTEGFSVRMVMRRQLDKAQDFAQRHGIEEATDQADYLIRHPEIDAVYIATPPDTHLYYALQVYFVICAIWMYLRLLSCCEKRALHGGNGVIVSLPRFHNFGGFGTIAWDIRRRNYAMGQTFCQPWHIPTLAPK